MINQLFPAPFPNETVYSLICRFHFYAANSDFKKVTLRMLGVKDARPANEFPPYLRELAELSGIELNTLIFNFTNIHYFQPFMEQSLYANIWASLMSGDTSSLQSRIGAVANRITPGQALKYCPLCSEEDYYQFGASYWHRNHQLVGVTSCAKHGIHLQSVKRQSKRPQLPPLVGTIHQSSMFEQRLSELVVNEIVDIDATWQKSDTYKAYFRRLNALGMLTQSGRIKHQQLKAYLVENLEAMAVLEYPFPSIYDAVLKGKFSECLFYRSSCTHQPIKHFVFILSLFDSWSEFKKMITAEEHERAEEQPKEKFSHSAINWDEGLRLVSEGASLRAAAKIINTTVSTLKIKAQQNNLTVDTRPSKITPLVERAIWRKLILGKKTQDIAKEFNVSTGAIEKVLTKHLWLPELRKRIRYYEKLKHHEAKISHYLSFHPNATRNEIRKDVRSSYYWLYKHEQKLLYRLLPDRVKAIYWPRK